MAKQKVVIIGAGPAGLTAGYELLSKFGNEYDVIILEASKDIGGISKTVKYNGNRMDIGGHRFFSKNKEVTAFWENIMPIQGYPSYDDKLLERTKQLKNGGPDPEKEDRVFLIRNRVSRIYFLNKFFDYPISLKFETLKNMGLGRTIKSGFSYLKAIIFKKKEDSLENFYINRFGKELYSMFFEKYTEKLWGRHPREISADWGAQRVKGVSITAVLKQALAKVFNIKSKKVETSLIEEFYYPKYGPGQFWETLASEIEKMGGKIIKNSEVFEINNINGKIELVRCKTENGIEEYKADIFISSMPLKELVLGMNNVPEKIKEYAEGLSFIDFQTVGLLVKKLNLENKTQIKTLNNIVPDCWVYVHDKKASMLRFQIFNNWSPYLVKEPEKYVWVGLEYTCSEGDEKWNMTDADFIEFAIKEMCDMKIINRDDVVDSHREKVKKAYPAYFDTYSEIDKIIDYINKYENLYCIGRNGQHRYNNMDHSMVTAFETVKNIVSNTKDKTNIWNVNTEKEYHEEKNNS